MMRLNWMFWTVVFVLGFQFEIVAQQDSIVPKYKSKKAYPVKISKAADDLKESLDSNNELKIAKNYETLAKGFSDKQDFAKAEEYLKKALASYTKLNLNDDRTRVARRLAKVQESQNKVNAAIKSYEVAGAAAEEKKDMQLNNNDADRLRNSNSPAAQAAYSRKNIDILEKESSKKEEVADAYVQQATVDLKLKDKESAIQNFEKAITYSKDKPEEVVKLRNEIAKVYVADNQFEKAISINQKLLDDAVKQNDFDTQIKQLQSLSTIYFKKEEPENAVASLKKAYSLASHYGKTDEVKSSLKQLLEYYKSNGKQKESMALYEDFFKNFDQLIKKDSTLIDEKTFQVTEDRIKQLEKEKQLKDELISKKNTFNYFLIGISALLLLLVGFIVKALYSIKTKNKEIALQSLRREMNPHFIFNSLNSVNQFISQNKELEANKYLSSYSHLMRNMMENSNKDFISLSNETEQLKKYLDLEHLRFQDKFDYQILIDDALDTEVVLVPNMLIQPHLENAIWHGLRYRETKGLLLLKFELNRGEISVIVDDNGIGLTQSAELKTRNQKVHQSRGVTNTKERINLLNELYKTNISFSITEKNSGETGTVVKIVFPKIEKV